MADFDDDCTAYHDDLERRIMEREITTPMGNQPVCRCGAYEWPHRMGYGLCDVRPLDVEDVACKHCGSTDVKFFDQDTVECQTCGERWRDRE